MLVFHTFPQFALLNMRVLNFSIVLFFLIIFFFLHSILFCSYYPSSRLKSSPTLFQVDRASMAKASALFIARDPDNTDEDKLDRSVLHTSSLMEDAEEDPEVATFNAVKVRSKRGVLLFFFRDL